MPCSHCSPTYTMELIHKIAKAVPENGSLVVEISKNIETKTADTIAIDALANNAFLGTYEDGLSLPLIRKGCTIDGRLTAEEN
jgi:hypothetical protein